MEKQRLKYFECPTCHEIPRGKILQCRNGHPICEPCFARRRQNLRCYMCGELYDSPPARALVMEQMIAAEAEGLEFACVNSRFGCPETFARSDLENHEKTECKFKPVLCPLSDCDEPEVGVKSIFEHLTQKHKDDSSFRGLVRDNGDEIRLVYQDPNADVGFVHCFWKFDNRVFLASFGNDSKKDKSQLFWVRLLGESAAKDTYKVRATLHKPGVSPSYEYEGAPNAPNADYAAVRRNRRALVVTNEMVERYRVGDESPDFDADRETIAINVAMFKKRNKNKPKRPKAPPTPTENHVQKDSEVSVTAQV